MVPGPYETTSGVQNGVTLDPTMYLRIENTQTGDLFNINGPTVYIPGPYDRTKDKKTAITLAHNQYVKVVDTLTGKIRVERGEATVRLEPTEELIFPTSRGATAASRHIPAFRLSGKK